MKGLIRSPENVFGAFLRGAAWLGCAVGIPIGGSAEAMIFKSARTAPEFWQDNLWLGVTALGLLFVGGTFNAISAALYKMAYDNVK